MRVFTKRVEVKAHMHKEFEDLPFWIKGWLVGECSDRDGSILIVNADGKGHLRVYNGEWIIKFPNGTVKAYSKTKMIELFEITEGN